MSEPSPRPSVVSTITLVNYAPPHPSRLMVFYGDGALKFERWISRTDAEVFVRQTTVIVQEAQR